MCAARSSVEGSSSLNTFVQVTRTDGVFGTHSHRQEFQADPQRCECARRQKDQSSHEDDLERGLGLSAWCLLQDHPV